MRVGLAAEVSCVSCSSENRLACLIAVAHTYRTSVSFKPNSRRRWGAHFNPRWFLNDSSMKLRHPVIYSLVHIGAHGADVHKAPGTSFLRFRSSEAHPLSLLFSLV